MCGFALQKASWEEAQPVFVDVQSDLDFVAKRK